MAVIARKYGEFIFISTVLLVSVLLQFLMRLNSPGGPDAGIYLNNAELILRDPNFWADPSAFQTNYWPMLYSVFLAGVGWVASLTSEQIQLAQSILFLGLAPAVWLIVSQQSRFVRVLTLCGLAISPGLVAAVRTTGYEILLAFFITWSVALTTIVLRGKISRDVWLRICTLLAGLSLGLAVLTNSRALAVGLVLIIFLLRRSFIKTAIFALGAAIPLISWGIRNLVVLGEFSFTTTNGPINVWIGSNPEATTGTYMAPPVTPYGYIQGTYRFMLEDPALFVDLLFRRMTFFWGPARTALEANGMAEFAFAWIALVGALILLAGTIGWWFVQVFVRPNSLQNLKVPAVSILAFFVSSIPFLVETRYRIAIEPLVIAVTIPTIIFCVRSLRKNENSTT